MKIDIHIILAMIVACSPICASAKNVNKYGPHFRIIVCNSLTVLNDLLFLTLSAFDCENRCIATSNCRNIQFGLDSCSVASIKLKRADL